MTLKTLLSKYNFSQRSFETLYQLSPTIKNLTDYCINKDNSPDFNTETFHNIVSSEKPLERIFNRVFFLNQEFILNENVFCPRNETELLVQILIEESKPYSTYIDLCSGTGIIGISVMLKNKHLKTTLLDLSPHATENIRKNLLKFNLKASVIEDDWLNHLRKNSYEVISANFPYIGSNDPIEENVIRYDPEMALFAEENGWIHYRKLLDHLQTNGDWKLVILECSALSKPKWNEAKEKMDGLEITIIDDLNGLPRVVLIKRREN